MPGDVWSQIGPSMLVSPLLIYYIVRVRDKLHNTCSGSMRCVLSNHSQTIVENVYLLHNIILFVIIET